MKRLANTGASALRTQVAVSLQIAVLVGACTPGELRRYFGAGAEAGPPTELDGEPQSFPSRDSTGSLPPASTPGVPFPPAPDAEPIPSDPHVPDAGPAPPSSGVGAVAFPGAEGFGTATPGGRGGRVIEVVNLDDAGAGSLRACIEASGPRICVFRTGGTIAVDSHLDIENPFITIAGQTAPGEGITLRTSSSTSTAHLRVRTHDVIIRYIRCRPGTKVENGRALSVANNKSTPFNVVIDHVSMSWSGDEIFIAWYDANNITIQWSSMSESLPAADGGYKGPNLGDEGASGWLSLHHNLIAHHNQRFPITRTGKGPIDLVNNVMYNLGRYGYANLRNATKANLVNNYVKPGPSSTISTFIRDSDLTSGGYYQVGNVVEPGWSVKSFAPSTTHAVSKPFPTAPIVTSSAQEAFSDVVAAAGAVHGLACDGTMYHRPDAVDTRIGESVTKGTRGHAIPPAQTAKQLGFISDPAQVGGWPTLDPGTPCPDTDHDGMADAWEQKWFGTLSRGSASNSSGDFDSDGYTDLEEFLNQTDPTQAE